MQPQLALVGGWTLVVCHLWWLYYSPEPSFRVHLSSHLGHLTCWLDFELC